MTKRPLPSEPTNAARLEAMLESVSDCFYALDTQWRYVIFNRAAEEYFNTTRDRMLGKVIWNVFPQGLGTPFEAALRAAMDQGVSTTFETSSAMRPDRVVELRIAPMRGGGVALSMSDITERRQGERLRKLLVSELNHRVKNSLATVQAIAAQSLKGADVSDAARERFMARLMALARANDLLVAEDWSGADMAGVAAQVSSPYADPNDPERFVVSGPPIWLKPHLATAMSLALHELATNAAKYGALSTPAGRVTLSWEVAGEPAARRFVMGWRETAGPAVRPPKRTGFGTRLIERGLRTEMGADISMVYAPGGLIFTLDAPINDALREGEA